ncbi:MAG: hypothetical protein ACT6XY_05185 [Phreatobacter sp.]|uniref:hypothetical protein n=1 Tax=Phreatobacter sp. TaxID=1966341 RepID=UPI00403552DD
MQRETLRLSPQTTGCQFEVEVYRFGTGSGPRVYVQAGLHADEVPGYLLAVHLIDPLIRLEEEGAICGTVTIVPCANPIGLSQRVLGEPQGRFDLASGANFNRGFPDVSAETRRNLPALSPAEREVRTGSDVKRVLRQHPPSDILEELQGVLLRLSCDAETILDLHSNHDAELFVYAPVPGAGEAIILARWMGAPLVITTSGGESGLTFEDASIGAQMNEGRTAPDDAPPPFVATVELRGQRDVSDDLAARDARSLLSFLAYRGALSPDARRLPPEGKEPLVIQESEVLPVVAPRPGILLFQAELGAIVDENDVVATLIDPASRVRCELRSPARGRIFSRTGTRYAVRGVEVVRVAPAIGRCQRRGEF